VAWWLPLYFFSEPMDEDRFFLGDVDYMRDFFPHDEQTNQDGSAYVRPYVDSDDCVFLPSIVGYIRDIIPAEGQRQVRRLQASIRGLTHTQLLVLSKPTASPLLADLFIRAYRVADEVIAFDREDTSRVRMSGKSVAC
jgi:hypothetical protein